MQFGLSGRHLAFLNFFCEVNAYKNQQFAFRRAKQSCCKDMISDFVLGQHIIDMEQARR